MAFKCFLLDGLVGDLGFDKFISVYKVRSAVILPLSLLLNMKFLKNRRLSTPPCPCIYIFSLFHVNSFFWFQVGYPLVTLLLCLGDPQIFHSNLSSHMEQLYKLLRVSSRNKLVKGRIKRVFG